jgi:hypothetical protein
LYLSVRSVACLREISCALGCPISLYFSLRSVCSWCSFDVLLVGRFLST